MHRETRVAALYRYPVKSMRGERIDAVDVTRHGLVGDRQWAVTFPDGRVGSGKSWKHVRRLNGLLAYSVTTTENGPLVRTPQGRRLPVTDPDLAAEHARRGVRHPPGRVRRGCRGRAGDRRRPAANPLNPGRRARNPSMPSGPSGPDVPSFTHRSTHPRHA
ncbi:MOSC N-terminal beta barrel domain-containing protein [Kitasatospora purpeofusca]|uniref:MOSC N-terminal beta barrel domain-containing protein n=1 Tax=Kitasatospora purpeofusca TaxID=67352 RepID=UPI0030F0C8BA